MYSDLLILAQKAEPTALGLGWKFLIRLAAAVLGFVLGILICRLLRLPEFARRAGLVLAVIFLGLVPFGFEIARAKDLGAWKNAVKLGIDLAGGTNLIYEVDMEKIDDSRRAQLAESMMQLVPKIQNRVNPSGTEEISVNPVGTNRIEVIMPGVDREQVDTIKRRIVSLGALELNILATQLDTSHVPLINDAERLTPSEKTLYRSGVPVAHWRRTGRDETADKVDGKFPRKSINASARNGIVTRTVTENGEEIVEYLVIPEAKPQDRVTGEDVLNVESRFEASKGLVVTFSLKDRGANAFRRLTTKYQPRTGVGFEYHLAIQLDNELHSAPTINEPIPSGQVEISGGFTQQQVNELSSVLKAGSLSVPLRETPINEFTISPTLGIDVQEKGKSAIIWSGVIVFLFMIIYYMFSGVVADICLLANLVLLLGIMAEMSAAFTLPGLAGIVLTIGMAVDANVLIYERMREEQAKGSSLRMTIHNGFDRALSAIVDSNVTTLITAVVLYMIGSVQIRGFAVSLFVGLVVSMFTALFMGRLIFDIAERKRWIKDLKMMRLIGVTNFDFIGKKWIAIAFSTILILTGLAVLFVRGQNNLDVDFRGGSLVTFQFEGANEPTVDETRAILAPRLGDDISLERLQVPSTDGKATNTYFRLRTTNPKFQEVQKATGEAFAQSKFLLLKLLLNKWETKPLPTNGPDADRFVGGNSVSLTFDHPISATYAREILMSALEPKREDQSAPTVDISTLIEVQPADGASATSSTSFNARVTAAIPPATIESGLKAKQQQLSTLPSFLEANVFESNVAGETRLTAFWAVLFSLVLIIIYLWFRFERVPFGLAAVVAVFHDVLVALGAIPIAAYLSGTPIGSIFQFTDFKINMTIIASFLTIIGYSLNDTIVIFDRVREIRGKNPAVTPEMVNLSLNQTMSRTILTSFTVLMVVVILYFLGGEGLHGFAFSLLVGTIVGTYSTIFIACPVLIWLMNRSLTKSAA